MQLDGQHQDVDRTLRGRVNQNDRGINGESKLTSMVWPTLGSRTPKEQNPIHTSRHDKTVSSSLVGAVSVGCNTKTKRDTSPEVGACVVGKYLADCCYLSLQVCFSLQVCHGRPSRQLLSSCLSRPAVLLLFLILLFLTIADVRTVISKSTGPVFIKFSGLPVDLCL